jgi:hypothetical protein
MFTEQKIMDTEIGDAGSNFSAAANLRAELPNQNLLLLLALRLRRL